MRKTTMALMRGDSGLNGGRSSEIGEQYSDPGYISKTELTDLLIN